MPQPSHQIASGRTWRGYGNRLAARGRGAAARLAASRPSSASAPSSSSSCRRWCSPRPLRAWRRPVRGGWRRRGPLRCHACGRASPRAIVVSRRRLRSGLRCRRHWRRVVPAGARRRPGGQPRPGRARGASRSSILETVPDAMVVIDEAGADARLQPAAERLFGWSAAETVVGSNVHMLMPSPHREAHDGYLCSAITGRRAADHRARPGGGRRAPRRRDVSRWNLPSARCGPQRDRVFTGFVRDLTERQQSEARDAGAADRAGPCLGSDRAGRDGLRACPRDSTSRWPRSTIICKGQPLLAGRNPP